MDLQRSHKLNLLQILFYTCTKCTKCYSTSFTKKHIFEDDDFYVLTVLNFCRFSSVPVSRRFLRGDVYLKEFARSR